MGASTGGIRSLRKLVEENPEVARDLAALFNFDVDRVFLGLERPQLAFRLLRRLVVEPWSEYRAKLLGGEEHLGWSVDTYKTAELINHLKINTEITRVHGSKAKPKEPTPTWIPDRVKLKEGKPVTEKRLTLDEFDVVGLAREMNLV